MADATFEELIGTLNDLIETCRDGINGFRTAADGVSSPIAKEVFLSRVHLIEKGLGDLDAAVQRLGGDPIEHGHPAASMHRAWINIKSAATMRDDRAIINEVVRGEEVAIQHYREALEKPLPADIRAMVEMQELQSIENGEMKRGKYKAKQSD